MERSTLHTGGRILALAAALTMGLASACSNSSSGGGTSPSSSPSASEKSDGSTITIGVAVPDLSVFIKFSKAFGVGNPQQQAASVLNAAEQAGTVPLNGHPIKFVYKSYSIVDDAAKQAVCETFAQQDKVFAVIGGQSFETGAKCLAQRFHIPVLDLDAVPSSSYQAGAPDYFTLQTDQNILFKNYIDWADKNGYFKGRKLGMYIDQSVSESADVAKQELTKLGYKLTAEVTTNGSGVGSNSDQAAMTKFQSKGVDTLIPFVGGSSEINALGYAAKAGYKLKVVDLQTSQHTTDVAAGAFPADLYNGTYGLTMSSAGEAAAGLPLTAEQSKCIDDYNTFSGKNVKRVSPETSGEYGNLLETCDMAELVLKGLENAGVNPTQQSFISGLEQISNMPIASGGNVTFNATDHWGIHELRTLQWTATCHCWTAKGDFFPISTS